jgi:hypothetical protein
MVMKLIHKKSELVELAKQLGIRSDWHEPEEQEVGARVLGSQFDNAGFWGPDRRDFGYGTPTGNKKIDQYLLPAEMSVVILKHGEPVAEVNLATLFAWATGFEA